MLTHIKDNKNAWTVIINGKMYQFNDSHVDYEKLQECVRSGDADLLIDTLSVGKRVEDWSYGNFEFKCGALFYQGEQVAEQPTERILEMIKGGWDHLPMLKYLDMLYQNVSNRAVQESYTWSAHKGLPIDENGYMLGYKGVVVYSGLDKVDAQGRALTNGDLVDKYTGTIRNNVGDTNVMSRRQVCDDHQQGCAQGLHVGTYEYAHDWAGSSGKVVLVRFSPADIVSVPSDCSFSKMRVSKYEVIGIARDILSEVVFSYEEDDEDDQDDIYDDESRYWHDGEDEDAEESDDDLPF
jgi:hypothetical protein